MSRKASQRFIVVTLIRRNNQDSNRTIKISFRLTCEIEGLNTTNKPAIDLTWIHNDMLTTTAARSPCRAQRSAGPAVFDLTSSHRVKPLEKIGFIHQYRQGCLSNFRLCRLCLIPEKLTAPHSLETLTKESD